MESYQTQTTSEPNPPDNRRSGPSTILANILETLILSVMIFLVINAVIARIRVDGTSMEPTLHNGELVVVNKLAYRLGKPHIGDVIVFHYPRDPREEYIKRVIGLPGDRIRITDGQVFVNDIALNEPYVVASPSYPGSWIVPLDSLFVLGDNRNNSSDSHAWGSVPMDYVVGRALFIYWPPNNWGNLVRSANAAP